MGSKAPAPRRVVVDRPAGKGYAYEVVEEEGEARQQDNRDSSPSDNEDALPDSSKSSEDEEDAAGREGHG